MTSGTATTGTLALARLAARRDRIQLPVWLLALTGVLAVTASSILELYADPQQRIALLTSSARSAVALVFNGLVSGTSQGATVASQAVLLLAVAAALMSTFAVVRHTRQNEETGRAELLGSAVVGRHAGLAAALLVTTGANVVLALLLGAVLTGYGLPVAGSFALGAAVAAAGVAFAAVATVAVQVAQSSRGANGLAAAAVGVAFLLRAVGDVNGRVVAGGTRVDSAWPSWLSPIGWAQQIRPYDDNAWWLLGLVAGVSAVFVGVGVALAARRDMGAGLLASRPAPAGAGRVLSSPLGLAWRLQRSTLAGWAAAMLVLGATFGVISQQIEELVGGSAQTAEAIRQLGGGAANLTEAYLAAMLALLGIAVGGYVVQALLRLRGEEAGGAAESVLATAVSRARWAGSHITVTVLGAAALLIVAGLSAGVSYGLVTGRLRSAVVELTVAGLVQLPATLALAGFAILAFGLVPRAAVAVSWAAFAACLLLYQLGPLLGLPEAVLDLSPFSHIPAVPAAGVTVAPLIGLLVVAAALTAVGLVALRRRDLAL